MKFDFEIYKRTQIYWAYFNFKGVFLVELEKIETTLNEINNDIESNTFNELVKNKIKYVKNLIKLLEPRIQAAKNIENWTKRQNFELLCNGGGPLKQYDHTPSSYEVNKCLDVYLNLFVDAKTYLADTDYLVEQKITEKKINLEEANQLQFGLYKYIQPTINEVVSQVEASIYKRIEKNPHLTQETIDLIIKQSGSSLEEILNGSRKDSVINLQLEGIKKHYNYMLETHADLFKENENLKSEEKKIKDENVNLIDEKNLLQSHNQNLQNSLIEFKEKFSYINNQIGELQKQLSDQKIEFNSQKEIIDAQKQAIADQKQINELQKKQLEILLSNKEPQQKSLEDINLSEKTISSETNKNLIHNSNSSNPHTFLNNRAVIEKEPKKKTSYFSFGFK